MEYSLFSSMITLNTFHKPIFASCKKMATIYTKIFLQSKKQVCIGQ
jgi:hypothetical protein